MKEKLTILLTGVGGPGAPGMIHCYRSNGEREIRIIGADMNPNAAGKGLTDAFYPIPKAADPSFIDVVLNICLKEKVDIIVPIVTRELAAFAANRERFARHGILVSAMSSEQLYIVNDKGRLLDSLREHGLPTARYRMVHNTEELFEAIDSMGYPNEPVCLKITNGNGSRGIRMLDLPERDYDRFFSEKPDSHYISYEYLRHIFTGRTIPEMMVMELLPGSEYSVDVIAESGRILAMVCRRGIKVVSSIQVECVIEHNEAVESLCADVIRTLDLTGQFGFDLKCAADGTPHVLEINPRLTAGIVACAAAGCNLPYFELLRLRREPLPAYEIRYGTVMTRRWQEVFLDENGNELPF